MSRFAEKLNVQNCLNSTENYVYFVYGMSGFAEKLKIQNCVSSTGNWVHYKYRLSAFTEKLIIQNYEIQQEIGYIIVQRILCTIYAWIV